MPGRDLLEVPRPRGPSAVILVVGDQLLTAQAVGAALRARGHRTHATELLHELDDPRRLLVPLGAGPSLGLMLHERVDRRHTARVVRVLQRLRGLPWLVLTGSGETPTWGQVLAAGARGVLPVTVRLDQLLPAVGKVADRELLHTDEERARLIRDWEAWSVDRALTLARLELLSPRESEVLEALRQGSTVAEVARAHEVSVDTVRSQVRSVLKKLEVGSQLTAVALLQQAIDLHTVAHN